MMKNLKVILTGFLFFSAMIFGLPQLAANAPLNYEGRWAYCAGEIVYECENVGDDCFDQWCCGD